MKSLIFFLILLPTASHASNPMLTYDPTIIELTGTLDLQTFPGPPNYENIRNGDDIERYFYLILDAPIDVKTKVEHPSVDLSEEERNVRIVQLAIDADDDLLWTRFRKIGKGGHVKIFGSLFHRFTGHHHSRVLLSVQRMEPLAKRQR